MGRWLFERQTSREEDPACSRLLTATDSEPIEKTGIAGRSATCLDAASKATLPSIIYSCAKTHAAKKGKVTVLLDSHPHSHPIWMMQTLGGRNDGL